MPSKTVIECSRILKENGLKIAFAESATAGRMASEFALTKDSGSVLLGGLVCYDACIKESILDIPTSIVEEFTPESAAVTKEMAIRLSHFISSDISVAVTGLTTPGGSESPEKPVGTIFIHITTKDASVATHEVFNGSAEEIILKAVDLAAKTILGILKSQG